MTTSDIGKVIEEWCAKNITPVPLDDLAQILSQRFGIEVDCGDLYEKLDDMKDTGMVSESSRGMFEIRSNWKDF